MKVDNNKDNDSRDRTTMALVAAINIVSACCLTTVQTIKINKK